MVTNNVAHLFQLHVLCYVSSPLHDKIISHSDKALNGNKINKYKIKKLVAPVLIHVYLFYLKGHSFISKQPL